MFLQHLWRLLGALTLALAMIVLFWINPFGKILVNQLLGLLLVYLGLLPLWRWARKNSVDAVPVLALIGFFYALCYGIGGLVTPGRYLGGIVVAESEYTPALIAALVSWGALNAGFVLSKDFSINRVPRLFSKLIPRHDSVALWIGYPLSLIIDQVADWFGLGNLVQITGALHTFFFIWVLHSALTGSFSRSVRGLVLLGLLPIDLLLYSGLSEGKLAGLLVFGQMLGLTYVVTKGRIPYLALAVTLGAFFLLQPVKNDYRMQTWYEDTRIGRVEGIGRFVQRGLRYYTEDNTIPIFETLNASYSRVNHLHSTARVMADTPGVVPFRYGETYMPLFTVWIPRAIWPEKPREDLGNRWAQEYRYLGTDDYVTSFNLRKCSLKSRCQPADTVSLIAGDQDLRSFRKLSPVATFVRIEYLQESRLLPR